MSSLSKVTTFKIEKIDKHPNADNLEIVYPFGFTSIVKRNEYSIGDIAAFIPPDMVVSNHPVFEFVGNKKRIRAIKLRGIVSAGLVFKCDETEENVDVTQKYGVMPYVHITESQSTYTQELSGEVIGAIKYTDIESLRRYPNVLCGQEVVITEKLHGANFRFCNRYGVNYIGSRNRWIKIDETQKDCYNLVYRKYNIDDILSRYEPRYVFFGEIVGVQDLRYNASPNNPDLFIFDIYDIADGHFLSYDDVTHFCTSSGLPAPKVLWRGLWNDNSYNDLKYLAEGVSNHANHIREGFVVRPVNEYWHPEIGRLILKLHGDGYLTRK